MGIFRKAKRCTSQIPCRYKVATFMLSAAVVVYAIAVPIIIEMA
jgi:hypothetical protein